MPTDVLERDREIATLMALLRATAAGHGHVAVISGEAGIDTVATVESTTYCRVHNNKCLMLCTLARLNGAASK